ncbi:MAG: hypothetical protein LBE09_09585 [Christensenellaceae bacterium]|jgi:hypothetical protein|nr:hypothetical protein [Christensenellaceae bacterium]
MNKKKFIIKLFVQLLIIIAFILLAMPVMGDLIRFQKYYNESKAEGFGHVVKTLQLGTSVLALGCLALLVAVDFISILLTIKNKKVRNMCIIVIPLELIISTALFLLIYMHTGTLKFQPWGFAITAVYIVLLLVVKVVFSKRVKQITRNDNVDSAGNSDKIE